MDPETQIRDLIRQVLVEAGVDRLHPAAMQRVEEQTLELMDEFVKAPEDSEDEVYARGAQSILRTIRHSPSPAYAAPPSRNRTSNDW